MEKKVVRLVLMVEPDALERIKAAQARRKVFSRSELVRQLIDEALSQDERSTDPKESG
jgi:metal-responsive CopG/Arc/MetJ family transcriptional regulator